jgi:hypothetical protein
MEYITITSKRLFFCIVLFFSLNCASQEEPSTEISLTGVWKCVKHDYVGYQKFTLEQAEKIRASKLYIENNRLYYKDISFVEPCNFYKLRISNYDTTNYYGNSLEFRYTKKELSKTKLVEPINENGELSCFNNCSFFVLKQDTLINICGGYTYYLIKEKN